MADQMVTANRLTDGAVVFLAADGSWVEHLAAGQAVPEGEAAAAQLKRAEAATRAEVVAPYLIDVGPGADGGIMALRYRERIRAGGPSVPWLADSRVEAS
jgi:hypothetical protein